MVLDILTYRDPDSDLLFKATQRIEIFDQKLETLADNMRETLLANDGLGLAAPQIRQRIALCVVRNGKKVQYFCNPEIISPSEKQEEMEEGCLSFPNVFMDITRPKEVEITYQDIKGRPKSLKASGILARTLQHEIDHLNGIAFIERT